MPAPTNAPSHKRASRTDMIERADAVAKMLLNGASRTDVHREAAKLWSLSARQADRLIDRANVALAAEAAQNRQPLIGTAYRRYNAIFAAAMRVQDYERALKAQDRIVALFALQAPPPARTLNLNVDTAQLQALLDHIEGAGLSASDVFAAMIEELAYTAAPAPVHEAEDEAA